MDLPKWCACLLVLAGVACSSDRQPPDDDDTGPTSTDELEPVRDDALREFASVHSREPTQCEAAQITLEVYFPDFLPYEQRPALPDSTPGLCEGPVPGSYIECEEEPVRVEAGMSFAELCEDFLSPEEAECIVSRRRADYFQVQCCYANTPLASAGSERLCAPEAP